ncbi:ATP-binding cassette sub-family G member 4 [Culicoides brevitarsis]|uniref:ATP-binding cassette sub-family G member 4 n=1 Tax=Culicoides brevitarsis TaxID=469753 RepID=UPI00307CAD9E
MSIKKQNQKIKLNVSITEQSLENNPSTTTCINSINSQQVSCSGNMNATVPPIILENFKNGNVFVDINTNNGDSPNNLNINAQTTAALYSPGLVPKVQNDSPDSQRKGNVTLTHLPKRPPIDIEFQELMYSISEGRARGYKTILKGVSGKFRSGELTSIMGPSGAGKSTLMNILAGYKTSNLTGTVLINGNTRSLRKFRKMSCYIMQDDQLLPYLTVKEAMMVSANLKLGKDITESTKKVVIEEIMETLGLSEAANTKTMNLSGGQRKRLSVALELVNNPPVMFFDEPTSGLDSSSCSQLISLLKSLARGGRTIICTIHQPSARLLEMFDQLYLLAEGQCVYQGQVLGLVPFLHSMGYDCPSYHNPADFVMEVVCEEHGECVHKFVTAVNNGKCNNYNQPLTCVSQDSSTNFDLSLSMNSCGTTTIVEMINEDIQKPSSTKKAFSTDNATLTIPSSSTTTTASLEKNTKSVEKPVESTCSSALIESSADPEAGRRHLEKYTYPTSTWLQFYILLKRTFVSIIRDKTLTQMRLLAHVIVGAIIGMIYYDIGNDATKILSNSGCIFFTTLFTMFTAMMPTILTFPTEMAVFVREHLNYWYSLKAFYFAKTIADLPFQILFSSVYVITVYMLTSQPMEANRIIMFVVICILTSLVAQSLGLLIGAGLSVENGVFLGPVSTIPTILFSGFFVNFDVIPKYLQWVTYVSYVRYGFEGAMISIYGMDRERLDCKDIYCHFRNPKKFLEEMSMENAEYWVDAVALIVIFVALRIMAYFVLKWKLHSIR